MRAPLLSLLFSSCLSSQLYADQFNVEEMPVGAEVTLPGAAKTFVSVSTPLKIGSTDLPQTISIVPMVAAGAKPVPVMVSIFDAKQDRVKYVQVAPGSPFLYSFKGLSTISLQTTVSKESGVPAKSVKLRIESDKPLTVAR